MAPELIILCIVSFFAGFIDAIVGGGGLLQTPAIMIVLPHYPVATLFGTTKIPSLAGTSFAAWKYAQHVTLKWSLVIYIAIAAFIGAVLGAYSITLIDNRTIKPVVLLMLIAIAVYTYLNKSFGVQREKDHSVLQQVLIGVTFGFVIGFMTD